MGSELYAQEDLLGTNESVLARINAFDWASSDGFETIIAEGGFDAVIGNPPYVRIQILKSTTPEQVDFLRRFYQTARRGNYDVYVVFVERSLSLLKRSGRLGFILPNKFMSAEYGAGLREILASNRCVDEIVNFGAEQVFSGATTYTAILLLSGERRRHFNYASVRDLPNWIATKESISAKKPSSLLRLPTWNFAVGKTAKLVERLQQHPVKLGEVVDIFVGLQTSADSVYIMERITEDRNNIRLYSKALSRQIELEDALLHPLASGTNIRPYMEPASRQYILFPYEVDNESASLIPFQHIADNYPKTAAYLMEVRKTLEDREGRKFRDEGWYRFGRSQNLGIQSRLRFASLGWLNG